MPDAVAAARPSPSAWTDRKRHLWLFGLLLVPLPVVGAYLADVSGWDGFWFLSPAYFYLLVPLLDLYFGEDRTNPPESAVTALEADPYYRRVVVAYIPLQYLVFGWGAWMFAGGDLSLVAKIGLVYSIALIGGGGINAAHEIGHKRDRLSGWLAKIALAQTGYGHFYIEHNRGHHRRVATPEDPASARFGESFYRFWPRTVFGSLRSAWSLERQRLAQQDLTPWSWHNHNMQAWSLTLLLFGASIAVLGWTLLPFLLIQAVIGFSLLEVVNYVEHYGLRRKRLAEGSFERVRPEHSWNSNHLISNLMIYHLQRHSDHHAHWARSYQALRHREDAPQLPSGYASMIMVAMIPPLWRRIMDPRVIAHYDGDLSRANVAP